MTYYEKILSDCKLWPLLNVLVTSDKVDKTVRKNDKIRNKAKKLTKSIGQ